MFSFVWHGAQLASNLHFFVAIVMPGQMYKEWVPCRDSILIPTRLSFVFLFLDVPRIIHCSLSGRWCTCVTYYACNYSAPWIHNNVVKMFDLVFWDAFSSLKALFHCTVQSCLCKCTIENMAWFISCSYLPKAFSLKLKIKN